MRKTPRVSIGSLCRAGIALVLLFACVTASADGFRRVERVSVSSSGEQGNGISGSPALSADGRYVAFASDASNLVPGDTNGQTDVFVRDRVTGVNEIVSLSATGRQAAGLSGGSKISADGRLVLFIGGGDLLPGSKSGGGILFLRDRQRGTTEPISVSSDGTLGDNDNGFSSASQVFSADGRFILFDSDADNLVPGDTNLARDVFVRDRLKGTTERVSISFAGDQADRPCEAAAISGDGRYVTFTSSATNLVLYGPISSQTGGLFIRDRQAGTTERVSLAPDGSPIYHAAGGAISADGRYVAFVALDRLDGGRLFLRDRVAGTTELIALPAIGTRTDEAAAHPSMSSDGRYVVFETRVPGAVGYVWNGAPAWEIYLWDRVTKITEPLGLSGGPYHNRFSFEPTISGDGGVIAFDTPSDELVPGDTNETDDVFVVGRAPAAPSELLKPIAVFRPSTHEWFLRNENGSASVLQFGGPSDLPVPADYFATGSDQIAALRPETHDWFLRKDDGTALRFQWGGPGDLPVPADYQGSGHAQIAVLRPATHEWFVRRDWSPALSLQFGGPGDTPVPADYLGRKRVQFAVFRPATHEWFLRDENGGAVRLQWGGPGDLPVPGDYLGLGHAQVAVFRPSTAEWFLRGDDGKPTRVQFGAPGDMPVPADYDGLGRTLIAVFRPSSAEWFIRWQDASTSRIPWGRPGDQPVPGVFAPHFGLLPVPAE